MTNRSSAARYARALLDVGRKEGDPRAIDGELGAFVALVRGNDSLARVLVNPSIPAPRKSALVKELLSRLGTGPIVTKLIVLLADRDRFVLLSDLQDEYHRRLLDHMNVVQAEVTSAVALPPDAVKALEAAIAERTGRTVAMTARVDASLIGGVVTRIGSVVYDGSVKRQLEKMKDALTGAT